MVGSDPKGRYAADKRVLVGEKETRRSCGSCNPYKLIAKEETDKTRGRRFLQQLSK